MDGDGQLEDFKRAEGKEGSRTGIRPEQDGVGLHPHPTQRLCNPQFLLQGRISGPHGYDVVIIDSKEL